MTSRRFRALAALLSIGATFSACRSDTVPRLVVVVSIDQLRAERLDPTLPGGLGRLAREGAVFTDAEIAHGITETCPGHVTLVSGRYPGASGIPGNEFFDAETGRPRYCVGDDPERAGVFGAESTDPDSGRSPAAIRTSSLGEWLEARWPDAKIASVSAKDRSAIAMGGRAADAVYWFSRGKEPGFTTSRHYAEALPDWIAGWNAALFAGLPERWEHPTEDEQRVDDYPAEDDGFGRTSGHPVRDPDPRKMAAQLYTSPFIDDATLALAGELVRRLELGADDVPDLLLVSLSATDTIGHRYGPESLEARDALVRLDTALAAFLAKLPEDETLIALSADHGVLSLPEWLEETGRGMCPVEPARIRLSEVQALVTAALDRRFGGGDDKSRWLHYAGSGVSLDREIMRERGLDLAEVIEVVRFSLEEAPGIARTWTAAEIRSERGPYADLYKRSLDPERSGDLIVQVAEGCLVSPFERGTTHGSPYAYDRKVPLLFFGPGIAPRRIRSAAATVDLAPTVAARLGIVPPGPMDGRDLLAGTK